jgi:hypothetical protein
MRQHALTEPPRPALFSRRGTARTPRPSPSMPDDHSPPAPPLPIPNRTVKRRHADDSTEFPCESRSSSGTPHPPRPTTTVGRRALGGPNALGGPKTRRHGRLPHNAGARRIRFKRNARRRRWGCAWRRTANPGRDGPMRSDQFVSNTTRGPSSSPTRTSNPLGTEMPKPCA